MSSDSSPRDIVDTPHLPGNTDKAPPGVFAQDLLSVDEQRRALRTAVLEAQHKWRILFVGRFANGSTDVVACLERALRTLGHRVFHVDPAADREVLSPPTGRKGGFGPVYVDLGRLERALNRFRPHLLVYCAGGLVLRPEQQADLRRRGILSLGMTLSDPDVMPSVIGHVGLFDYHTTNSLLALSEYVTRGLKNTLYFPFGVDRDFVVQQTPQAPELAADAICLGHAAARPERQQAMARLAERFRVRVYGNGWPFPDSAPVTGSRLIQAARAATFHVNFPGTRAGHVNVKCGVFESVGAGAVLCTARFPEMERFFKYGDEILGYGSTEELVQQIAQAIETPGKVEAIRRGAFARLISEHLYERRWEALFQAVLADLRGPSPAVGADARALLARLLEPGERPRTVVISGWFGAANAGDDLILEGISRSIEERVPNADIVVVGASGPTIQREHGLRGVNRLNIPALDDLAQRATAVILGGGGLWHDYTFASADGTAGMFSGATTSPSHLSILPTLASIYGRPFHVFGMGVGPLVDDDARSLVRWVGDRAASITVRDQASLEVLRSIEGWKARVDVAPDVVFGLDLPRAEAPLEPFTRADGRPVLGLNLRPWPQAPHRFYEALMERVMAVAESLDALVVTIPLAEADAAHMGKLAGSGSGRMYLLERSSSDRLPSILGACTAVLAMRLHACILAHRTHRPVVGLAYDPKVAAHFQEVDRADWAFTLREAMDERRFPEMLTAALNARRLSAEATERINEFEHAAQSSLGALASTIASTQPPVPRPTRIRQVTRTRSADLVRPTSIGPRGTDAAIRASIRYRLGDAIVSAVRPSRHTLALPVALGQLFLEGVRKSSSRRARPALRSPERMRSRQGERTPSLQERGPRESEKQIGERFEDMEALEGEVIRLARDLDQVRSSVRFRLGDALVSALRPSSRTFGLPVTLVKLLADGVRRRLSRRKSRAAKQPTLTRSPKQEGVPRQLDAALAGLRITSETPARALAIAGITDQLTEAAIGREFKYIPLGAKDWMATLERERPDLLLVASTDGAGSWSDMKDGSGRPDEALAEMLAWCRAREIPTVLWVDDDPPEHERSLVTGGGFSRVLAARTDRIARYRQDLGEDVAGLLPVAFDPRIYNPTTPAGGRRRDVGFLASGRTPEAAEAAREIDLLIDPARPFGLQVYQEGQAATGARGRWPYGPSLPIRASTIPTAYKRHSAFLVDSDRDPAVVGKELAELLACGTSVITGDSPGTIAFREHIWISRTPADTARALRVVLGNPELRKRRALQGLRRVLRDHTQQARIHATLKSVSLESRIPGQVVSPITVTNRTTYIDQALANVARQTYQPLEWILVLHGLDLDVGQLQARAAAAGLTRVIVVQASATASLGNCLNLGVDAATGAYISKMDDDNFYGPNFINDLVDAFQYADADIVGKRSHYMYLEGAGCMILRFPGSEYRNVDMVAGSALIWTKAVSQAVRFPDQNTGEDSAFLDQAIRAGARLYSTDPYNYVYVRRAASADHTWKADDQDLLLTGRIQYYGSDFAHVVV